MKQLVLVGTVVATLGAFGATSLSAQKAGSNAMAGSTLGTVHIAKKVMADGKPLTPGTYQVRLSSDSPKAAVGESPDAERYVEFMRGGKVVAREVATVIGASDIGKIAKTHKAPKPNTALVETLKGDDYVRGWINKGGTNYLIHLPTSAS